MIKVVIGVAAFLVCSIVLMIRYVEKNAVTGDEEDD